jgi:hypothetical protein
MDEHNLQVFCFSKDLDLNQLSKLALSLETDIGRKNKILKVNYPPVYDRVQNDFNAQFGSEKGHFPEAVDYCDVESTIQRILDRECSREYVAT